MILRNIVRLGDGTVIGAVPTDRTMDQLDRMCPHNAPHEVVGTEWRPTLEETLAAHPKRRQYRGTRVPVAEPQESNR